jgi:hypothetical protein
MNMNTDEWTIYELAGSSSDMKQLADEAYEALVKLLAAAVLEADPARFADRPEAFASGIVDGIFECLYPPLTYFAYPDPN